MLHLMSFGAACHGDVSVDAHGGEKKNSSEVVEELQTFAKRTQNCNNIGDEHYSKGKQAMLK